MDSFALLRADIYTQVPQTHLFKKPARIKMGKILKENGENIGEI